VRHAPLQRGGHIAQGGRTERGHHPDAAHHRRQRAFARRIEQALGFQPGLEAQKLLVQLPCPGRLHALDDQLQVAARTIHVELASHLHPQTVARRKRQGLGRAAKQRTPNLPAGVFEVEVTMPAGRAAKARYLPFHRHRVEAAGQGVGNRLHQSPNWPHRVGGVGAGGRKRCVHKA
jgi:hypothetical protein